MFRLKKYNVQLIELFSPTIPASSRRYSRVSVNCFASLLHRDRAINHANLVVIIVGNDWSFTQITTSHGPGVRSCYRSFFRRIPL